MTYYFQIESESLNIAIVEKEFWDKNKCIFDGHLSLNKDFSEKLPDGFYELAESTFESDFDEEEAREKLIKAGFIEKHLFDM